MGSWYPIVHGRTAFVDFRSNLIVVPKIFNDTELEWAKKHILATTRAPEQLPGNPRWSVFQTPALVVVGVTCMASEVSPDMTREIVVVGGREVERRPLYVFLGYASRRTVLGLPPRDLKLFGDLYQFVKDRWREQWYESRTKHVSTDPRELPELCAGSLATLNDDDDLLSVLPSSQADELWASAANFPRASLCIGLPNSAAALEGVFHNATLRDQEDKLLFRREPQLRRPDRHSTERPDGVSERFRESPRERVEDGYTLRPYPEDGYDPHGKASSQRTTTQGRDYAFQWIVDGIVVVLAFILDLMTSDKEPGRDAPRAVGPEVRDGVRDRGGDGWETDRPPTHRSGSPRDPADGPARRSTHPGFVSSPKDAPKPQGSNRAWWNQESGSSWSASTQGNPPASGGGAERENEEGDVPPSGE
jgi:hypothetical protein